MLAARAAWLVSKGLARPQRILALTFTNRAAREMQSRIRSHVGAEVSSGTFHSFCNRVLRSEAPRLGYPSSYTIVDEQDRRRLLGRIIGRLGLVGGLTPASASTAISEIKRHSYEDKEVTVSLETGSAGDVRRVLTQYQSSLRDSGCLDFDDMLTLVAKAFRQFDDVLDRYASMFDHLLVDEYQDTNGPQRDLLLSLSSRGASVFVVGDDDQSIYGWRGARLDNILRFEEDFPHSRVRRLEVNYRSTSSILKAAQALVSNNVRRHPKALRAVCEGGEPPVLRVLNDQRDEARWIMETVRRLEAEGVPPGEVAVLFRTNAQSLPLELEAHGRKIPYQLVGTVRFFERAEVKDVVSYLRLTANPEDRISLERILNVPPRGVGKRSRELFLSFLEDSGLNVHDALKAGGSIDGLWARGARSLRELGDLLERIASMADAEGVAPAMSELLRATGYTGGLDPSDPEDAGRLENLEKLGEMAEEFDRARSEEGLRVFLEEISLESAADEYRGGDGGTLSLLTLHCAKGLEFDTVLVSGVEEGLLPLIRRGEKEPSDVEEERRLLYVGMTRAKRRLYLTMTRSRRRYGNASTIPSRFLMEMADLLGGDVGEIVSGERHALASADTCAEQRYEPGNLIDHPRFGRGLVTRSGRAGSEWELTVDFGFDEPKILRTGYVPIRIIKRKGSRLDLI